LVDTLRRKTVPEYVGFDASKEVTAARSRPSCLERETGREIVADRP